MKNSVEICSVRKACPLCNFGNAERAFPQKAAGFVHAYLQQIFRKTDLHILLKHTSEVFGRYMQPARNPCKRKRLRKLIVQHIQRFLCKLVQRRFRIHQIIQSL